MSTAYSSTGSYYKLKFLVDGSNNEVAKILDSTFTKIRIVNRVDNNSPLVFIEFNIDNQAFIEHNFYPQASLTMQIFFSDEDNKTFGKPLILDLVILEMNIDLPQKYMYNISEKWQVEHRKSLLTCVPRRSHEIMNAPVNKMWWDNVTVWSAVNQVIDELKINPKKIDSRKSNKTNLPQLIIPPMSFRNFLYYMDEKYGIYNDRLFFYTYYTGSFFMWGLKTKFDDYKPSGGIYTVHKMPSFTRSESTYDIPAKLARNTPNNYIAYDNFKTITMTNDPFIKNGGRQYHIFHPKYDISQIKIWDPISNAESNGIHASKKDLKVDTSFLKKRTVVIDTNISDENCGSSETSMLANYIEPAYKMNFLHFQIVRKIKPHLVMRVGEPVSIKMYAEHEKKSGANYEGSYMIWESELMINREQVRSAGRDTVFAECNVKCCRTSQSYN